MPVKTWATNDVPTASDLNAQFRDQVISTVTSGTRPSGTEGQVIYETDTDKLYIYNGGWVRFGAGGAWTSVTPTVTQSAGVTVTATYAKYEKIGRLVNYQFYLTVTGTGTANAGITTTLPFTSAVTPMIAGSAFIYDSSANTQYPALCYFSSTTAIAFMDCTQATSGVNLGQTGSAFAAALASNDAIIGSVFYEATT